MAKDDDNKDEKLEEPLEPEVPDKDEKQEEKPEETPDKPEGEEAEKSEEIDKPEKPEGEGERQPSRRESLRIQKLLAQNAELRRKLPDNLKGLDYSKEIDADDETRQKLEADRKSYGEQAFNSGLEQAKSIQFHTRLEVDAPRIESKYPQLNQESEEFNPAVADAINSMYLSAVGFDATTDTVQNPNLRYRDYVESFMELVEATAGEKVARTQSNIVKQVANTALRPSGGTAKRLNLNQSPEQMTDEELDAVIALGIPTKKR